MVFLPRKQMMRTKEYIEVLDTSVIPSMIGYDLTHLLVSKIAKLQDQIGQFTQIHWFFFLLFYFRLTRHLLTQVV